MSAISSSTLSRTPVSDRALSMGLVVGLHLAAGLGLLALAQPVIMQIINPPMLFEMVSAREQEQTAPAPKPLPMKARPQPQAKPQTAPQPVAPQLLQTAAPAPADQAVVTAAPLQQTIAAPTPAATESNVKPGPAVAETVRAPRHDADYLHNPKPEYPNASRALGEEGKVWLRVQVSEDGRPLQVLLDKSSGYQRLDRRALDTVSSSWRFEPARQGSKPVVGWVNFAISFELNR